MMHDCQFEGKSTGLSIIDFGLSLFAVASSALWL
jgi:hypothetical protein